MPSGTIVQLSNQLEALVCPVPPHASFKWQKAHIHYPDKPGRPMVMLKSELTGHSETASALPESAEWNVWAQEMEIWRAECETLRMAAANDEMDFSIDYAVVGWRVCGSDDEWTIEPPDDWQPRGALDRHGIPVDESKRRIGFIYLELLERPEDHTAVLSAAFPEGELDTSPVTEEEVSAVAGKFRAGDGVSRTAGSVGGRTGVGGREPHPNVTVRTRDAGGKQKSSIARRLVQLFKRSKDSHGGS